MTAENKQLKKNDFISLFKDHQGEAFDRDAIIDELEQAGYEFIHSYVDYLIDHFISAGRLEQNDDGDYTYRVAKSARTAQRTIYQVRKIGDTYTMVQSTVAGNVPDGVEEDIDGNVVGFGWSLTKNAAAKKASSAIFADYKARSTAVKDLVELDDEQLEEVDHNDYIPPSEEHGEDETADDEEPAYVQTGTSA